MEKRKRPPLPLDASPQEKYDNLILTFFEEWQHYEGQNIHFPDILFAYAKLSNLGFTKREELIYYTNALIDSGLLSSSSNKKEIVNGKLNWGINEYYEVYTTLTLSYKGLNYCFSLLESGKNSDRCFVAMKFSPDMEPFYNEGIAKAIEDNGFRPIRVDKEHTENEQTINDFIIASIKQSRFCIADLTHKSHGAYFEAGYALGRGLKVIYTCREDHFEEVHFDLKSMQIIRYSSPEELREALSLKIQAFVMD